MKVSGQISDNTHQRILDRAFSRFGQNGFGKTAMSEIAADCEMSAGNLYHYFDNKFEIGVECARQCMRQSEELLRREVRKPKVDPARRLENFVVAKLSFLYQQFSEQTRFMELVDYISSERWDVVEEHLEVLQALVVEILVEGIRREEFRVDDVVKTANTILAATAKFNSPFFLKAYSLPELQDQARRVTQLLVKGIS